MGYGPIGDARVTVGTTYRFFRMFRLPAGAVISEMRLVGSVGDSLESRADGVEGFELRLLVSAPSVNLPSPVPVTEHHTLLPAGSGFAFPDGPTPWEGTVFGLVNSRQVPVPPPFGTGGASARAGRCVLVVGWLQPGGPTVEGSPTKPSLGLIVDGRLWGAGRKLERCDTTEAAFAGFVSINNPATAETADAVARRFHVPIHGVYTDRYFDKAASEAVSPS